MNLKSKLALLVFSVLLFITYESFLFYKSSKEKTQRKKLINYNVSSNGTDCGIYGCIDDYLDFEDFDNENGVKEFIVPNIVHLLYLQSTQLKFYQMICIFSIFLNHRPGLIYIHCDNCSFHGKYWDQVKKVPDLWKIIKVHEIPFHDRIFGRGYGWLNHHRSDVWRLQILMNYGGIYLDNDVYVVHPLHKYRHFEMTVSWRDPSEGLGVQVLIAHKNARLLKAHFDSYRYNYTPHEWYWNAGHIPATLLLQSNQTKLAHVVKEKLGTHNLIIHLYRWFWEEWKSLDAIHLLINHRSYLDKTSPIKEFDEFNILNYNYTWGFMCRDIMMRIGYLA